MHRTKLSIPRPDQDPPYEYVELDAEQVINALVFTTIYDDELPEGRPHYFGHERAKFLRQIADFIDTQTQPHTQPIRGVPLQKDAPKQILLQWHSTPPPEPGLYIFTTKCRNYHLLELRWGRRDMAQDLNLLYDYDGRTVTNLIGLWYGPIAEPPATATNTTNT